MIPVFPFQHVPYSQEGLTISNDLSGLINVGAHGMEPSYIPGVEGKAWRDLLKPTEPDWDIRAKAWLEQSALSGHGFLMGSTKLLLMIGKALFWILKKSKDILVGAIGTALTVGATILDQLAWLISRAVSLSKELAGYVKTLINAIFRFMGRAVSTTVSITMSFLRWVLGLFFSTLSAMAANALSIII